MDAYDSIVHEFVRTSHFLSLQASRITMMSQKERRYDQWQRNKTINLVRAYLICPGELTVLNGIFS
jgi:hypothetical protein